MGQIVITYDEQVFTGAREIVRELEIAGYVTWYRWRDGCAGPSYLGQVDRRIFEAGAVIAVVSSTWASDMKGAWLRGDIQTAREYGKKIVVVLRGITEEQAQLSRAEWAEAFGSCAFIGDGVREVRNLLPQLFSALTSAGVEPYEPAPLPPELAEKVNQYRLPAVTNVYAALGELDIARTLPRKAALKYKAVPLENIGGVVVLAISDPSLVDLLHEQYFVWYEIEPVLATEESIIETIRRVYDDSESGMEI